MRGILVSAVIVLAAGACAEKRAPFSLKETSFDSESAAPGSGDTNSETEINTGGPPISTDSDRRADSDTGTPSEAESDTGTPSSDSAVEGTAGALGDPCWIEVLKAWHPNAGLPGCAEDLHCVGDNDEAWCTVSCDETGSISDNPLISGWCCGEVGSACAPTRYYMPETMSLNCAPRTVDLGDSCQASGNVRCAPLCNGGEIVENVVCVQVQGGGFCSYDCETAADCEAGAVFSNGCCAAAMGNTYCMPATSDRCLSP